MAGLDVVNAETPTTNKPRKFNWSRIVGYDFFISFKLGPPPIGAQSYASDLARRLRELDFTVFFSEEEAPPGEMLDTTLVKALHKSRILIVVANEGALIHSQWVKKEVEEFRRKHPHAPITPINIDRAIEKFGPQVEAQRWLDPDGRIWLNESQEALNNGITSPDVLKRIEITPRFIKANTKITWGLRFVFIGLTLLTTLAVWQWREAENQARIANAQKLAAQARVHFTDQPDLAALLSNEASRLDESVEVKAGLLDSLEQDSRLQTFLRGHTAPVQCVAFSKDGKLMATGGNDRSILIWDAQTWKLLGTLSNSHQGSVFSLAFSPDHTVLASGGTDQMVRLWDATTQKPIGQPLTGHTGMVRSIIFHPEGKILFTSSATESGENETFQWDLSTTPPSKQDLNEHETIAGNLAISPDGKELVLGEGQGSISMWDIQTHALRKKQFNTSGIFIQSLSFSPDGKLLAASDDNGIDLWDLNNKQPKSINLQDNVDFIQAVAISPDGKTLAGGGNDASIHLWDLSSNRQIARPLTGHKGYITSLAFHPDGTSLVSGSEDGTVIKWSLTPQSPIRVLLHNPGRVLSATFSLDGHWLATGSAEGVIRIWELSTHPLTLKQSISTGHWVTDLRFTSDGNTVFACHDDRQVRLWNIGSDQPHETGIRCDTNPSLSNDGTKVFALESRTTTNGEPSQEQTLAAWEIPSGKAVLKPTILTLNEESDMQSYALSNDGKYFAIGMSNGLISLWDLQTTPVKRRDLPGHTGPVSALAFSPDSTSLVSGGHDTTIRLWDSSTGNLIRPPFNEGDRIDHLAFNSTGTTIAVLYSRLSQSLSALHFWDVKSGKTVGSPLKGAGPWTLGSVVAFSPNGNWVITGGDEDDVVLWDMDLESWRAQTCRKANRNLHPTEEWPLYMAEQPYHKTCPELPLPVSIPRVIHAVEDETF